MLVAGHAVRLDPRGEPRRRARPNDRMHRRRTTTVSPTQINMNDERAARGVEHLQAAAMEMIAAARAFLDVVEDVVADPDKVADVVSAVGSVANSVSDAARDAARGTTRARSDSPTGDAADPDDGVQRIQVS